MEEKSEGENISFLDLTAFQCPPARETMPEVPLCYQWVEDIAGLRKERRRKEGRRRRESNGRKEKGSNGQDRGQHLSLSFGVRGQCYPSHWLPTTIAGHWRCQKVQ